MESEVMSQIRDTQRFRAEVRIYYTFKLVFYILLSIGEAPRS